MIPGGGQPNMQQLLQQAQKMQQDLARAQEELAATEVDGHSGGGLVKATVTGSGELRGLVIDPKAVDPEDTETLADLVVAAVQAANENAQKLQQEKLGPLAQGLGGGSGIPAALKYSGVAVRYSAVGRGCPGSSARPSALSSRFTFDARSGTFHPTPTSVTPGSAASRRCISSSSATDCAGVRSPSSGTSIVSVFSSRTPGSTS